MAAATLSSGAATATGRHTATLTVTSNQATGTVYAVVTRSSSAPSHAQIVAGTDGSDARADWFGSATAALSNSFSADSIPAVPVKLYAHFTQTNGSAENSTPVSSSAFKPTAATYGTLTANGDTDEMIVSYPFLSITGTFGSGTFTWKFQNQAGEWVSLADGAFTAADQSVVDFGRPTKIKGTLSGATNPDLDWEVR